MHIATSWMWGGVVHEWSQVTSAEGMDADEWRDIFLIQWNPAERTSLNSKHPRYNRQFQKSQLSFHLLQFLSNPWIVNTPLLCITDSFHCTNCTWTVLTISAFNPNILDGDPELSLVPRPFLFFSLHYIVWKMKQKQRTTGNEATKLKCSNSGRYFNWLTASRCPCSHSQAPTPTFCYLYYTSLYCTLRWHKASGKKWECSKRERYV